MTRRLQMKTLVIGGTGPTGPFIVEGLLERGHEVAILHSGNHEVEEIPPEVEHIHTDPFDPKALADAVDGRHFDHCIATYGRLRVVAEVMQGRCDRFLSVGGGPCYRGYMNPEVLEPAGLPVPTAEDAPLIVNRDDDEKGYRIARTEEAVFALQPEATHFRYPYVYGPRQPMPREWSIVRRILDRRPFIVLPDGGLTLCHYGYAGNLAHAVLLAVDRPEACAGRIYNCGDSEVLTLRQVVEVVAAALGAELEIVSMPWSLARPARPLVGQIVPTHRVYDLSSLKQDLGYRDAVPVHEALARTARWLAEHPCEPGGPEETVLQDPFDYAAEDVLVDEWRKLLAAMPEVAFDSEPGLTMGYSGPGGRPRTTRWD
jgi:nucleoside-diphosphate-sugar epimerase